MGFHRYDPDRADNLEDEAFRFRYLSREELLATVRPAVGDAWADLGSGTGFYTDMIADHAGRVYAVDVQPRMHEYYERKGPAANVELVTADIDDLPLPTGELDGAFSTMTYHEFAGDGALAEVARVLRPGGRLILVDWSADGPGEAGPPTDERYPLAAAVEHLRSVGFLIETASDRPETFLVSARIE